MKNKYAKSIMAALFVVAVISAVFALFNDTNIIMATAFAAMTWDSGQDNMGGFKNRMAFIPESLVSAVPTIPSVKATAADYVTAAGTFTFKETGGKALPIYATRATVGYKADIQGETDCKSYKIAVEFFHPGSKIEVAAFARQICNTPGYLIIEDEEKQIMIGQKGYPCTISPSFDGGKAPADKRGYSFTGEADSMCPMIVLGTKVDIDALFDGTTAEG